MKWTITMFSIVLLFLTGCSDKKEVNESTPEVKTETVSQNIEKDQNDKEVEVKGNLPLKDIEAVKIPETIEDLASSKPGELTGNGQYFSAKNTDELQNTVIQKWIPPGMIDIISKQWSSPKGTFAILWQEMDVEKMSQRISYAINVEQGRFIDAINLMQLENMITEEQKSKLLTITERHKEKLEGLNEQLKQQKLNEIDMEVNRIDGKINDWAARMEKLREEGKK